MCMSDSFATNSEAYYQVKAGTLHRGGKIKVSVLPIPDKYKVLMEYNVKRKEWVPVPKSLLNGKKEMEFPKQFETVKGYEELEQKKTMDIPKAKLVFVSRVDVGDLKQAYKLQVLPTNKKSKIDIIYHPSLPSVGWKKVVITFISNIPLLDGYELQAELK